MNDDANPTADIERALRQVTPRGAPEHLRSVVLHGVATELGMRRRRGWDWWCAAAAGLLLLIGVVANVWVQRSGERRLAELMGPEPIPSQIAELGEAVASVADAETANLVQQLLLDVRRQRARSTTLDAAQQQIEKVLNELRAGAMDVSRRE